MSLNPEKLARPTQSQPRVHVIQYLSSLGGLLAGAVAILTVAQSLPRWFLMIAAGFYVVAIPLISWTLWPPVLLRIQQFREQKRREAIAGHFFPELETLAERFGKSIDVNRSDSILYVMWQISQQVDPASRERLVLLHPAYVRPLFDHFTIRLLSAPRSFSAFASLATEFTHLVWLCHCVYVYDPYKRVREVGLEALPEPQRKPLAGELELRRENYSALIRDFQNFAERVNQSVGREDFLRTYYEQLKRID